jgi:hypothetical protein
MNGAVDAEQLSVVSSERDFIDFASDPPVLDDALMAEAGVDREVFLE